jgi:hypothetical protein
VKVHYVPQRSDEWHALRCGKLTGSGAQAVIQERKRGTGELAKRAELRQRLVVERLTGIAANDLPYLPKDMQHGVDTEPAAVCAYEAETGELVTRIGFVEHDTLMAGCSPDGCVGNWEGAIEIKCPASSTHLEYLQANAIPEEHYGQLIHTLWLTGAQWVDFCSFDPRFQDPAMRLFRKRLPRDVKILTAYELAVSLFLSEVDKEVEALRAPKEVCA